MRKQEFDFENERNLNNTYAIFEGLLFADKDKNKVALAISNIEHTIPHAKAGLEKLLDLRPKYKEEIYIWLEYKLKLLKNILEKGEFELKGERLELLNNFHIVISGVFGKPVPYQPMIKLKINANKNVVYDLFRQLKKEISLKDNLYFLSQTDEELAKFITSYIEGFENSKSEVIAKEIAREQPIKGQKLQVKVID